MPLPNRVKAYWPLIQASAAKHGLDPMLVAAVMDRESLCGVNLTPPGPTGTGDYGAGLGMMQVDKNAHPDLAAALLFDGTPAWQDAAWNIEQGCIILAQGLNRFPGCKVPEAAMLAAYNAGAGRVRHALMQLTRPTTPESELATLDHLCTGGDYASDVLRRRAQFAAPPQEKP